jgi:hypothetical protein
MTFLKEALKKLRTKLLVKVLEKQDELLIKAQNLTNLTLAKLQETTDAGAEKTAVSIAKAKIEILSSIDKTTAASINMEALTNNTLASLSDIRQTMEAAVVSTTKSQTELKTELKALLATDVQESPSVSLKAEKNLRSYLRLLKGLSKRYTILIAVKDTPGAFLTDEIAAGIKALGLSADLSFENGMKRQYHRTYIGAIDRGQVVCETLSKQIEPSYYRATRNGVSYDVVSKAYIGNIAEIKIDGIDYATNRRGLNIVVFDLMTKTVIDSVCFDAQVAALTCSRLEEIVESLEQKLNALALCGYNVPQYCIDNNIKSVIIYSEKEYWHIAGNICMSFQLNREVNVCTYCAVKPFNRTPLDSDYLFTNINFVNVNDVKPTDAETVLMLHPNPQVEIINKFQIGGARVVTLEQMTAWMYNYVFNGIMALVDYSAKHPDVRIVCFRVPAFPTKDLSAGEREIIEKGLTIAKVQEALRNGQLITRAFDGLPYTNEEILGLFGLSGRICNPDGEYVFTDRRSRLVNYASGRRVTTDQPVQRKRSIFALGRCLMAGGLAPDDKTICSYLQRRFNEDAAGLGVVVENYTIHRNGICSDAYKKLSYIPVKPNDIILVEMWAPEYFPSIDLKDLFQRPHNYGEMWVDPVSHFNENAYRPIADALFKFLQERNFFETSLPPPQKALPYLSLRRRQCSAYPTAA